MARYLGPTCKLSRREGSDLMLKSGARSLDSKCKLGTLPGQHGAKKQRGSDYSLQLRAKQKLKRIYGLLERQFRNCYQKAAKQKGATGENLLNALEMRLDNVVYRMGFSTTRAEARQLVSHCSIILNDNVVNIPSYLVCAGDVVGIKERSKKELRIKAALALSEQRAASDWLSVDPVNMTGTVKTLPPMEDLLSASNVHLVVELYSK